MILLHAPLNGNRVGRLAAAVFSAFLFCVVSLDAAPPAAPEGKRFLFIIDTSASMKAMEDPLSEALFDLIYSGVRGKMTNGDSYGVWLINEQNDTSFKMAIWKDRYAVEMAAKAVKHVKDKGFRGRFRLGAAVADAAAVIRSVEDLTIILISNGQTPIVGTPFDDIINLRFRELAPHMQRAKVTLNTALVAQGGQIVAWAANTPEFLIEIPYVAPRPKPAPVAKANPSSVASASATSNPPAPRIASNPIIITRETVAKEKRIYQALASTASTKESDTAIEPTNAVSGIASNAPATNATVAVVEGETNSSATDSAAAPETNTLVAAAEGPSAIVSKPETVQLPPSNGAEAEPQPAARISSPLVWAGAGAGAALLCVIAGFLLARSRRSHPSLISESISQQRITAA